ncbi:class I SAM-dependent DNA methyltransferase [Thiomicrorhabdus indica]|uniref:class I SAM-dependent DNA methyltransferase n=1 Tax=Thiomicrorhabdus indica TaxID=2267253 RepID=UPI002AA7DC66|nr:DNA methyltransferase [Thiomicrorhabdus indica]
MNAVEIEEAISQLAEQEFDAESFPYAFLEAFGNKPATIKRLKTGSTNSSDMGGVLQRNNIHMTVCEQGSVADTLFKLKDSPATKKGKVKFILATDGEEFQAEDLNSGETVACEYQDFPNHFGFFLPLAGITTVKQVRESSFDIRATSRLNRLYVELLKDNPEWGTNERRHDMNHFMARLIFCFFAEDTDIFNGEGLFTQTVEQMSERDSSNTHEVIGEMFRAMNTKIDNRKEADLPRWADQFPYVNGGLFSGSTDTPKFSKIARSYLIHIGNLDWQRINPDIFGSMIQAVTDEDERGELGMHYTSVPNILKVLNPLFLDELREKLEEAGENQRMLLNLRKRISKIRVFDPACGSGNFLVIAYKQLREIEAEINLRRGEPGRKSEIPITNFRGIELRDFAAEVARLALIIAEYQCDVLYRGQKEALAEFLPLNSENWITQGNALRLDWLSICPPTGTGVKMQADDLFETPLDQSEIDFENEGGETYICGNPPYKGTKNQSKAEKDDLKEVFQGYTKRSGTLDYVCGWFLKAAQFCNQATARYALVSTNSICQGGQVPVLWPILYDLGMDIDFAYQSFKWSNLAANNAGVTVIVVGLSSLNSAAKRLFITDKEGNQTERTSKKIGPYLIPGSNVIVKGTTKSISNLESMSLGNAPYDGGNLIVDSNELTESDLCDEEKKRWVRPLLGSSEIIKGTKRYCIWVLDDELNDALQIPFIRSRIEKVKEMRLSSKDSGTKAMANRPHQFREMNSGKDSTIAIPLVSSENREYLTPDIIGYPCSMTNKSYAIYDGATYNFAVLSSKMHLCWIAAVSGRMKTDYSYSNKMGWNTFPLPKLTEKNKEDLTRCAEDILLARESHFPATIADLYDPEKMPENLRLAHERNDEVLERIYIGRRFKNDTERLEKLFDLYTKMTEKKGK